MAVEYFEAHNFFLQKGGSLPVARLAYRTSGTLSPTGDNAVLIPSWFSGNDEASETYLTGTGRALDPEKYFLIFTNLLGGGRSSSPSNSPAPSEQGRFPTVTYYDNVRLQHALLTQRLGVEHLRLVTGWSMGACQAYQWAAQYPGMVRSAVPIAGSARTASYNKIFLLALRRALTLDPVYADGFYASPPIRGLKAFAAIYAGWGTSEPFFRLGHYERFGAKNHAEFLEYFWEPFYLGHDANNLLTQLKTWELGDISDSPAYDGDYTKALAAITAKLITVPIDKDRYFPPEDAEFAASHIPNGRCATVESTWGHMAPMDPNLKETFDALFHEALS
ncbi:homoserine O-acetyltransferase [Arboricoccus pini]|uniref:Homoserine O-acetyltransferase n=1 Tax=Arboricoccus pini TaxID=1963835 RepID=A0A212RLR8_9PROT|nr:alpha/beta fold hydrolase [Arboricoccus pini]SNB73292.1 homoserine O-acetyltransferase [Arboricoccus pini]